MYCFRERERILDLFEMLCGARVTVSYMRPGGVFQEPPPEFWPAVRHLLDTTPDAIAELERLISENEIVLSRTKGVGVLTKEQVIDNAVSGPNLRASGVAWDLRKADPYDVYDRMDFAVPVGSNGDSYDRFLVRVMEVHQSIRIAEQCFRDMPGGPVRSALPFFFRPPPGDAYAHVEASKGRARILPGQRRRHCALPLQDTLAILHQPDGAGGDADRVEGGGPDGNLRQS